jgi:tetratricopeptide (TPR) repeat protein
VLGRSVDPGHLWIAQVRTNAAEALGLLGRYDEAIAEERKALATYEKVLGPASENVGISLTNIGTAELRRGRVGDARRELERAIAIYEKALSPDNPDRAEPWLRLGQLELQDGHVAAAVAPLEQAWKARSHDGDPCEMLDEIEQALARAVAATNPARARKLSAAVTARRCTTAK